MRSYIKRIQNIDSEFLNNEIFKWINFYEKFYSISLLIKSKNNSRIRVKVLLDPKFIFHSLGFQYFKNLKKKFKNLDELKKFIEKKRNIKKLILSHKFENKKLREEKYEYFYSKFISIKKINQILFFNLSQKKYSISRNHFQEIIKLIDNKINSKLISKTDFIIKIKDFNSSKKILLFTTKSPIKCKLYKKIFSKKLTINPYKSKNEKILILYIRSLRLSNDKYLKKFKNEKYKIFSLSFDKK